MVVASSPCECGCRRLTNFVTKGSQRGTSRRFVVGHAGNMASAAARQRPDAERRARALAGKRAEYRRNIEGEHSMANVQASHPFCNLRKGARAV